jgi:glycosyltransferase involved in cell wall biosynthesis
MHDKVHIIGYVPDEKLVASYQRAKLFVLPSIFEPFGMTALEAMACGIPVVASKFGGIKTVISSGENGLLVDSANKNEFANGIMKLLKNRELAARLGQKGHETIHKYYSWEAVAEKHISFYEKFMH